MRYPPSIVLSRGSEIKKVDAKAFSEDTTASMTSLERPSRTFALRVLRKSKFNPT
jgi:hypothetical protein